MNAAEKPGDAELDDAPVDEPDDDDAEESGGGVKSIQELMEEARERETE